MGNNFLEEKKVSEKDTHDIPMTEIGEKFGSLRIVNPFAENSMYKSMEKYGQLTPVVVCLLENKRYELLDGFKRLRANRSLNTIPHLKSRIVEMRLHACKAAIILLNGITKMSDMEEALVVQSLYRDDCLTQVEIGHLLNRHKSWVSRRISLIERLCDEVQEHIKLGLTSISIGREIAKLPRGNQNALLQTIQQHGFTLRETEQLVSALLSQPKNEHEFILKYPEKLLDKNKFQSNNIRLSVPGLALNRKLISMENMCLCVAKLTTVESLSNLTHIDKTNLNPIISRVINTGELVINNLRQTFPTNKVEKNNEKI